MAARLAFTCRSLTTDRRMQAELELIGLDEETLQADFQSWRQRQRTDKNI